MVDITIRKPKWSDIYYLEQLGRMCLPIYNTSFDWLFCYQTDIIYVAESDRQIIGFVDAKKNYEHDNNCHIMSIAVHPDYRKQGVGKLLLRKVIMTRDKSVKLISLNVHIENMEAVKFYKNNRFIVDHIKKNYYGNQIPYREYNDAYHMIKHL
jgi:ribosomal-protein-alanine N-acetyltransferase